MIDIEYSAREWATDYKPFDDEQGAQEYARHGFEQGAKWMQQAIGLGKITIINVCDYQAIYNGDELIHYHDAPFGSYLLNLLGIDNEEFHPEDLGLTADDFDNHDAPDTLTELRQLSKDTRQTEIESRLDAARTDVAGIEQELADLGDEDA